MGRFAKRFSGDFAFRPRFHLSIRANAFNLAAVVAAVNWPEVQLNSVWSVGFGLCVGLSAARRSRAALVSRQAHATVPKFNFTIKKSENLQSKESDI